MISVRAGIADSDDDVIDVADAGRLLPAELILTDSDDVTDVTSVDAESDTNAIGGDTTDAGVAAVFSDTPMTPTDEMLPPDGNDKTEAVVLPDKEHAKPGCWTSHRNIGRMEITPPADMSRTTAPGDPISG